MSKIYVFLAPGFETVEALAVVDILRRAKDEVVMVAVNDTKNVLSAQKIDVTADVLITDASSEKAQETYSFADADVLFLPGGMPGTTNLEACKAVTDAVRTQYESGKFVAAICAAPSVFGHMGILDGKKATCYPGFEKDLLGATYTGEKVVVDGNVVTSKGMGTAVDLGLKLVELLHGKELSDSIGSGIQYL